MALSDAEVLAMLYRERDAILAQLVSDAESGLMPDDSFQGQSVNFTSLRSQMYERLEQINKQIGLYKPWQIKTVAG